MLESYVDIVLQNSAWSVDFGNFRLSFGNLPSAGSRSSVVHYTTDYYHSRMYYNRPRPNCQIGMLYDACVNRVPAKIAPDPYR